MKKFSKIISTGFGSGYSPLAPGTAGTLFFLIIYWLLPEINLTTHLITVTALFFIGVYTSTQTEQEMVEKLGKEKGHDASIIVIDEIVGIYITVLAVPKTFYFMLAAFILFRFFDIVKPFPINKTQNLSRGWGIMIDDVIAGIFANILIHIYIYFF